MCHSSMCIVDYVMCHSSVHKVNIAKYAPGISCYML